THRFEKATMRPTHVGFVFHEQDPEARVAKRLWPLGRVQRLDPRSVFRKNDTKGGTDAEGRPHVQPAAVASDDILYRREAESRSRLLGGKERFEHSAHRLFIHARPGV